MMTMYERYMNDSQFHNLVNAMYTHIIQGDFTPTEIREAAMMAQILYEERHPRLPTDKEYYEE